MASGVSLVVRAPAGAVVFSIVCAGTYLPGGVRVRARVGIRSSWCRRVCRVCACRAHAHAWHMQVRRDSSVCGWICMGMCVYACMHTWVRRLLNETQRLKSALTVLKDEQLASDEQQRAMRQLGAVRSMEDTKWLASSPEPRNGRVSLQERTPAASRGPGCDANGHARLATSAPGLAAPAPDSVRTMLALHRSDKKTELAATMLQRLEENRQSGGTPYSPCASSRRRPAKLGLVLPCELRFGLYYDCTRTALC